MKVSYLFIKPGFILLGIMLFGRTSFAQYDGSFNQIFFDRSVDARSEALGKISKSYFNNAFSVHQNSSLMGFQEGYGVSYSHSNPYYLLEDATLDYWGVRAQPLPKASIGISRFSFRSNDYWSETLSTVALSYRPGTATSIGANMRQLRLDLGERTSEVGEPLGEMIRKRIYFDVTAAAQLPYHSSWADEAKLDLGLTFENIFFQEIDLSRTGKVELPSTLTLAANNELTMHCDKPLGPVRWNMYAEYQNVLNYKYRTRYSLGTEISLGGYIEFRSGYYYETLDDLGYEENKSFLSELTYGIGTNIPLANALNIDRKIILSIDIT